MRERYTGRKSQFFDTAAFDTAVRGVSCRNTVIRFGTENWNVVATRLWNKFTHFDKMQEHRQTPHDSMAKMLTYGMYWIANLFDNPVGVLDSSRYDLLYSIRVRLVWMSVETLHKHIAQSIRMWIYTARLKQSSGISTHGQKTRLEASLCVFYYCNQVLPGYRGQNVSIHILSTCLWLKDAFGYFSQSYLQWWHNHQKWMNKQVSKYFFLLQHFC